MCTPPPGRPCPPPCPGRQRRRGCERWVAPETELSSLCLTPLFPPLSWSLSVGGGQTLGALPPAVQPSATTGVLRVLLLHAGDRALPSPWRRRLLRFPHSAQPLGGEQPRAGAPPAPRAPRRRQPQTRALGAPHLAVPAAAGVGPLHPQDLGWAPPPPGGGRWGGWGAGRDHGSFPGRNNHTLTHPIPSPSCNTAPYNVGPRYCNAHPHPPTSPFAWCQPNGAGRGGAVGAPSGTGQKHWAGATSGSRVPWKARCQGENACWVRVGLAWSSFCLVGDFLAWRGRFSPGGGRRRLRPSPVMCLFICVGQGMWPCV